MGEEVAACIGGMSCAIWSQASVFSLACAGCRRDRSVRIGYWLESPPGCEDILAPQRLGMRKVVDTCALKCGGHSRCRFLGRKHRYTGARPHTHIERGVCVTRISDGRGKNKKKKTARGPYRAADATVVPRRGSEPEIGRRTVPQ